MNLLTTSSPTRSKSPAFVKKTVERSFSVKKEILTATSQHFKVLTIHCIKLYSSKYYMCPANKFYSEINPRKMIY